MSIGRTPTDAEWGALATVQSTASKWCGNVARRLEPVDRFLAGGGDPRLFPPDVPRAAAAFEAHFKSRRPMEVRETREAFGLLKRFLDGLSRVSYHIVPDEVVDRETDGDTYGFVRGGETIIHLAQRFFDNAGAPTGRQESTRSVITVGPLILTAAQKARLVVHEAAHARLRVAHSGGKFSFATESCAVGYAAIRTYAQASNNAYCYDHFAFCLSL